MGAFSWLHLVVLALMLAVAVAVVVLSVRSWRRRAVNGTIGVTLTISAFYAAIMLIIAIGTVVDVLTSPEVTITVPVEQYWPQLPPGAEITDGPTATRVDGGFTSVSLGVSGLTTGARVLWAPYRTLGEVAAALDGPLTTIHQPGIGEVVTARSPIRWPDYVDDPEPASTLGADGRDVLVRLAGMSDDEVTALVRDGVVHE